VPAGRDVLDRVAALLQEVAAEVVEPRFERLGAGEVVEKEAGELVTVADREAELAIGEGLASILPGTPMVGEEAAAADPRLLRAVGADRAIVVDPVDGTSNFVDGSPHWALMAALLDRGEPVASWIWQPVPRRLYVAERGGGAARNGEPLTHVARAEDPTGLRGTVLRRYFDTATTASVERNEHRFGPLGTGHSCAGFEYPSLVDDRVDFLLFWRTRPWDHAPGVLLAEEAGGWARRPDGRPYRADDEGPGLLVAADEATWALARQILA
jgi:fructose-1,6-bisphosphatase/inositol monophosphatase family enzyme